MSVAAQPVTEDDGRFTMVGTRRRDAPCCHRRMAPAHSDKLGNCPGSLGERPELCHISDSAGQWASSP